MQSSLRLHVYEQSTEDDMARKATRVWSYYWRQVQWPQETFSEPIVYVLCGLTAANNLSVALLPSSVFYSPSTSIKPDIPFSSFNGFYPHIHLTSIYPAPLLLPWLLLFRVFSSLVLYWNLVFSFAVISLFSFYTHAFVCKHQKVTVQLKVISTLIAFLTFNIFITDWWTHWHFCKLVPPYRVCLCL